MTTRAMNRAFTYFKNKGIYWEKNEKSKKGWIKKEDVSINTCDSEYCKWECL